MLTTTKSLTSKVSLPGYNRAIAEMQHLVDKYADGIEAFEEKSSAEGLASSMATLNRPRTKPSGKHQDEGEAIGLKTQEVK